MPPINWHTHVKSDPIKDPPKKQGIKTADNSPRPNVKVKEFVESKGKGKVIATE
jgi:hypothetical protein